MGTLIPLIPGLAALAGGDVGDPRERSSRRLRRDRRRPPGRHRRLRPDADPDADLHRRPGRARAGERGRGAAPADAGPAFEPSRGAGEPHRPRPPPAIEDDAGDPLDGLVNLFDVGMILAIAFLIAGLGITLNLKSRQVRSPPRHSRERQVEGDPEPLPRAESERPRRPGRPGLPPPRRPPRLRQGRQAATLSRRARSVHARSMSSPPVLDVAPETWMRGPEWGTYAGAVTCVVYAVSWCLHRRIRRGDSSAAKASAFIACVLFFFVIAAVCAALAVRIPRAGLWIDADGMHRQGRDQDHSGAAARGRRVRASRDLRWAARPGRRSG